jgi:hypothetical protein
MPKFAFGKSERSSTADLSKKKKFMPGPGTYDLKSTVGEGAKVSIGCRLENFVHKETSQKPGPGQYTPIEATTRLTTPRCYMGTAQRESLEKKDAGVAPGLYSPDFKQVFRQTQGTGFGYGERSQLANKKTPGPGNYKLQELIGQEAPKLSIGARYVDVLDPVRRSLFVPGPGKYEASYDQTQKTPSKFSMGKEKRIASHLKSSSVAPAPGQYDPRSDGRYNQSPKTRFGKEQRPNIASKA